MPKPDNIKNIDKKSVQMNNDTECASPVPELEMSPDDVTESDSARATTWSTEGPKSSASIIDIQEDEIWSSDSEAEDITYDSEASGKNCDNSARELKPANNGRGTEDIDKIQSATTEENIEQASNDGSTSNEKNDIVSKESRDAAEERDQFQGKKFFRLSAYLIPGKRLWPGSHTVAKICQERKYCCQAAGVFPGMLVKFKV